MYQGERFNSWTHFAGTLLAVCGLVALLAVAIPTREPERIASFACFGLSLVVLYAASTLYHGTRGRAKAWLRKLDHCAIYVLIAGTYAPFALVTLKGVLGWWMLGAVWVMACAGIVLEFWPAKRSRALNVALYIAMGWLGLIAATPLFEKLGAGGFSWLLGGGVLYTAGVLFYAFDHKWRHAHGVWHLFVMAGSTAHFGAVLLYV
jgi:hemolysin III